jgi:hypothetical protein
LKIERKYVVKPGDHFWCVVMEGHPLGNELIIDGLSSKQLSSRIAEALQVAYGDGKADLDGSPDCA